jgi:DNA-binding transcriptional regulator YiaG
MNNLEFENIIENIDMSKKDFAEQTKLPYQTIMNWKRNDSLPVWVESWLENYIEKQNFQKIKQTLKDSGVCQ